jgi:hypothetical protein
MGIGLSAACGFRVFIPLLVVSIAARTGHIHLAPGWEWIGGLPAIITLSTATIVEIAAYYIPWLDHVLDTIAAPAALVAGTLVTAAALGDVNPTFKWALAIVAGGGVAGIVQAATMTARVTSTAATGGAGNFLVSSGELVGAVVLCILAIVIPVLALILVVVTIYFSIRFLVRVIKNRRKKPAPEAPAEAH